MIFFGGFLVLLLAVLMVSGQTTATARPDLKTGLEACGTGGMTCIGIPAGCAGKNESSCDVLAKVGVMGPFVHIDLSIWPQRGQKLALAGRWIAVGFSESGQMENSPVVHCFEEGGKAQPKLTYNNNANDNEGWKDIDSNRLSSSPLPPVIGLSVQSFITPADHPSSHLANHRFTQSSVSPMSRS
ncbi:hypothetical protein BV898_17672 [Hypsibius exemplaris]|uniref:Reelin domain-containing protein n=1 Tax=Hypsibius exemplaris TaxID=2072580 RepID=A0A9X6NFY3_HYPEX|nr:hypothetical protein BV898_17672 [Hypsibius exemplaris]